MATESSAVATPNSTLTRGRAGPGGGRRRRSSITGGQAAAGWGFVAPGVILLVLFLLLPIALAVWVSLSDWNGRGSPLSGDVGFVGADNYAQILTEESLIKRDFFTSLRNNGYYVLAVVPIQTVMALLLATILNQQLLKARSFFRTAFYFPSVTSSVAISLVFLFLFSGSGAINEILGFIGLEGPTWFGDSRGLLHQFGGAIGIWDTAAPPSALTDTRILGLTGWEWLSGPSVAMSAIMMLVIWTTTGTFMLLFLASLQDVPVEVQEAAMVDGANRWQRFRAVTLPHIRPTVLLVLTLGLIGTWQVFDQIAITTQGGPSKTTLTPAYLSYAYALENSQWGIGTAMAFLLFAIIIVFTLLQRLALRDRGAARQRRRERRANAAAAAMDALAPGAPGRTGAGTPGSGTTTGARP